MKMGIGVSLADKVTLERRINGFAVLATITEQFPSTVLFLSLVTTSVAAERTTDIRLSGDFRQSLDNLHQPSATVFLSLPWVYLVYIYTDFSC